MLKGTWFQRFQPVESTSPFESSGSSDVNLWHPYSEEGFGFRTISGSMPLKQRDAAIQAFQKDPPTTVFLLSMRQGPATGSCDWSTVCCDMLSPRNRLL